MSIWVADSAPLIILGKAGFLELVPALTTELLVPMAVARELRQGRRDDPARKAITHGFGTVVRGTRIAAAVRDWGTLGVGEAEAISLCLTRENSTLLCDDRRGRQAANDFGIPKIGTLGVLLLARQRELLTALVPAFRAVKSAGIYTDDTMLTRLAASVGEIWTP
jgi:predicted nucleic acid-binding protein